MESLAEIKRSMFPDQTNQTEKGDQHESCIMIIDDNPDIAEALACLLRSQYRLISCSSYEAAKQQLTPDVKVILLDIKMAPNDGIEVFKLLKQEREDLQIIFHSAYPGNNQKVGEVENLKHSGYLTKGEYDKSQLLPIIARAISAHLEPSDLSKDEEYDDA